MVAVITTFGVLLNNIYTGTTFATLDIHPGHFQRLLIIINVSAGSWFFSQGDLLVSAQGNKVFSWDIKNNGYWNCRSIKKSLPAQIIWGLEIYPFHRTAKQLRFLISMMEPVYKFCRLFRINITNQINSFILRMDILDAHGKKIIISSAQGI